MAEPPLVLCARSQAWLRYWRSLAWWQGHMSFDPVGEIRLTVRHRAEPRPDGKSGEKGCKPKQADKRVEERKKNWPVVSNRRTRGWRWFIRRRQGSTSAMRVTTSRFAPTGIPNQCENLRASP